MTTPSQSVTVDLYRAAIGPRAQDYYLRQFARFDVAGKAAASWNWAAFAMTLNWLAYRGMWGLAVAYAAVLMVGALLSVGDVRLILGYGDDAVRQFLGVFLAAVFLIPGLYGNAWYYRTCHERVFLALRNTINEQAACEALEREAKRPRRIWRFVMIEGVLIVLALGLTSMFLSPTASKPGNEGQPPSVAAPAVPASAPQAAASADMAPASTPVKTASAQVGAGVPAQSASMPASSYTPPAPVAATAPPTHAPASPGGAAAAPAKTPASTAAATPERRPADKAGQASKQWFVAVGAFAQADNARRLHQQLTEAGYRVAADPWPPQAGQLTRVWVGPYANKTEAQGAATSLKGRELPAVLMRR